MSGGNASSESMTRMRELSFQPPNAPARTPIAPPSNAPARTTITPMTSEMRAPSLKRAKTSRPSESVPIGIDRPEHGTEDGEKEQHAEQETRCEERGVVYDEPRGTAGRARPVAQHA